MTRDLGDLAASASRAAKAMPAAQLKGVEKSALHTVTIIRKQIASAVGPDMRMSGASRGKAGAKVGARYKVYAKAGDPVAYIRATGPLQLIERDTQAHTITARGRTRKKRGKGFRAGAKALTVGTGFRVRVEHPGTRGKHPFERGVELAGKDTKKIFKREIGLALEKAWG